MIIPLVHFRFSFFLVVEPDIYPPISDYHYKKKKQELNWFTTKVLNLMNIGNTWSLPYKGRS